MWVVPRAARRGRPGPLDPDAVLEAVLGAPAALVLARPSEADPGASCLAPLARALGRAVLTLPARLDAAAWTVAQGAAWIVEGAPRLERALAVACALPGLPPGAAALPCRSWGDGDLVVPGVRPRALARWAARAWRACPWCPGGGLAAAACARCAAPLSASPSRAVPPAAGGEVITLSRFGRAA